MEIKYHRELNHNYLITKCEKDNDGYKSRMLATNKLNGFLTVSKRIINNESYLFYEITSMQSLSNIYSIKGMTLQEVKKLLLDIKSAIETAAEYLLDESGIVFSPECIMENLSDQKHYFVYNPNQNNEWTFKRFAEEMLEYIDQNDEEVIQLVYNLCQLSEREGTMISSIIDIVCKKDSDKEDTQKVSQISKTSEELMDIEEIETDYEKEIDSLGKKKDKKTYLPNIILGILFAILMAFLLYIRTNYLLTDKENIMSLAIMALSFLMIVLSAISVVLKIKKKEIVDENNIETDEYIYKEDYEYETEKKNIIKEVSIKENNIAEDYGQTIVLDTYNENASGRLYGRDNDKTINIDLDNLPITIGKMSGFADVILPNESISRIHARIYEGKTKGELILEDTNSTNGTFLNGIRLKPQERVIIRPGDEIRFAKMRFDYR